MKRPLRHSFEVRTKRLVLRPLRLSDFSVWRDSHGKTFTEQNEWDRSRKSAGPLTRSQLKKLVTHLTDQWKRDEFYGFAVFKKKTGEIVGYVSLMDLQRKIFQNAYLGYLILNTHWGKGYCPEAVQAALEIGFRKFNLHRIEAGIDPRNSRSIAVAKRLGMRREGKSLRRLFLSGQWNDMYSYVVTCEDLKIKWKPTPWNKVPKIG